MLYVGSIKYAPLVRHCSSRGDPWLSLSGPHFTAATSHYEDLLEGVQYDPWFDMTKACALSTIYPSTWHMISNSISNTACRRPPRNLTSQAQNSSDLKLAEQSNNSTPVAQYNGHNDSSQVPASLFCNGQICSKERVFPMTLWPTGLSLE